MSFPDPPPPYASSEVLWGLNPDFPIGHQPWPFTVNAQDATKPPAPTSSIRSIWSSRKQYYPARGQVDFKTVGPRPHPLSSVNGNDKWNEVNRHPPGRSRFMHMFHSPYQNVDPYEFVAPPPEHTSIYPPLQSGNPLPVVNGEDEWDEANLVPPSRSPFMHVSCSPYPNVGPYDELDAVPSQHTCVCSSEQLTNPLPGVNGNCEWDEANGGPPSRSRFMHMWNSPHPNVDPCDHLDFNQL
ncbi:hypothetical protein L2E82_12063 [Cichorium intybus]|uniref:Uncharacterized protein n=1 Tax=Cichorium intybus TaxID=13427 RepID=A0ACB9GFR0_CICIN|nr:hypothetical protein L2E82_12063 [Cichorium intybus]